MPRYMCEFVLEENIETDEIVHCPVNAVWLVRSKETGDEVASCDIHLSRLLMQEPWIMDDEWSLKRLRIVLSG